MGRTPLVLVSHGSTMMMAEESWVTKDWAATGRLAEKHGIKGVVIMVCLSRYTLSLVGTEFSPGSTLGRWRQKPRHYIDEGESNLGSNCLGGPEHLQRLSSQLLS